MATAQGVIEAFVAAWHASDEAERARLLERCWADDGALILPGGEGVGREAVGAEIGRLMGQWPAGSRVQISTVAEHHGWLRYRWIIASPDGVIIGQGLHVGERAPDGRLQRVLAFYGPPPPVD